eukprot:2559139-Rhodomonas_salina.4
MPSGTAAEACQVTVMGLSPGSPAVAGGTVTVNKTWDPARSMAVTEAPTPGASAKATVTSAADSTVGKVGKLSMAMMVETRCGFGGRCEGLGLGVDLKEELCLIVDGVAVIERQREHAGHAAGLRHGGSAGLDHQRGLRREGVRFIDSARGFNGQDFARDSALAVAVEVDRKQVGAGGGQDITAPSVDGQGDDGSTESGAVNRGDHGLEILEDVMRVEDKSYRPMPTETDSPTLVRGALTLKKRKPEASMIEPRTMLPAPLLPNETWISFEPMPAAQVAV